MVRERSQSHLTSRFFASVTGWMVEPPSEISSTGMEEDWEGHARNSVWGALSLRCLGWIRERALEGYWTHTSEAQE